MLEHFKVFASRQMFLLTLLGFSSGLPIGLIGGTLQAWMKDLGVDLSIIGLVALVGLPYSLKFLWSPLMDRFVPPWLGRRRGWILICQIALMALLSAMALSDPLASPLLVSMLALAVAFFSASQDIVIDAYRAENLAQDDLGAGAAVSILGYRLAMLTSGALALILADHLPWRVVYFLMSAALIIGVIANLLVEERSDHTLPTRSLRFALLDPLTDFFGRSKAFEVLGFVVLYKIGDVMALSLATPFLMEIGFAKQEIGAVNKGLGLVATILGGLIGGAFMKSLGHKKSLLYFGSVQAITIVTFAGLAILGKNYLMLLIAVGLENLGSGMGTAAYVAFLMSICNKKFTATQYALLTSLGALPRTLMAAPAGFLVHQLGWPTFFVLCVIVALPGLILVGCRYEKWVTIKPS